MPKLVSTKRGRPLLTEKDWLAVWKQFHAWFTRLCRLDRCDEHSWTEQEKKIQELVNKRLERKR